MRRLEDVVVGDGQQLEGTSDVKQRPLELMVCDVGDKKGDAHLILTQNITGARAKNGLSLCLEPALLGCPVWWSRCPLVKNELTDIYCDSRERHRDSSLAVTVMRYGGGEKGERWWKYSCWFF
jgi:hypothetical protein